ncbi:hypothetical protein JRO89_XS01G0142300 [Xanthoceras sorbifolium]|uniref:Uncharacterized protein n=1 Tax=Xanthoceras sorbifolium TaxID=99658 RepID=A0ABQ8IJJ0_9ROSI|nr:hypothetical protein JRO89_XS01G0142300 [Xanthoceras sorbifolium]
MAATAKMPLVDDVYHHNSHLVTTKIDMENSMNSYLQQKPGASRETTGSPDHDDDDDQESGWTAYFDDFSNHRENSFCSSYIDSSSLVSDAAYSGAAWNHLPHNNHHHHHLITACSSIGGSQKIPKKLKFMKKTRTKEICEDDSLEDTASSPVNSPKVSDLEPIDMGHPRKADHDHMERELHQNNITHNCKEKKEV